MLPVPSHSTLGKKIIASGGSGAPPAKSILFRPPDKLLTGLSAAELSAKVKIALGTFYATGRFTSYTHEQFQKDFVQSDSSLRHVFANNTLAKDCITLTKDNIPQLPSDAAYDDVLKIMLVQQQFAVHSILSMLNQTETTNLNINSNGALTNARYYYENSLTTPYTETVTINCKVVFAEKDVGVAKIGFKPDGSLNIPPEYISKCVCCMEYTYVFDKNHLENIRSYLVDSTNEILPASQLGAIRAVKISSVEMHNLCYMNLQTMEPEGNTFSIPKTELTNCEYNRLL